MRIRINIKLTVNKFPVDYRRAFLHLLKNALNDYESGIYYREFFPEGRPQRKEYAFAVGLPKGPYAEENITIWEAMKLA